MHCTQTFEINSQFVTCTPRSCLVDTALCFGYKPSLSFTHEDQVPMCWGAFLMAYEYPSHNSVMSQQAGVQIT